MIIFIRKIVNNNKIWRVNRYFLRESSNQTINRSPPINLHKKIFSQFMNELMLLLSIFTTKKNNAGQFSYWQCFCNFYEYFTKYIFHKEARIFYSYSVSVRNYNFFCRSSFLQILYGDICNNVRMINNIIIYNFILILIYNRIIQVI